MLAGTFDASSYSLARLMRDSDKLQFSGRVAKLLKLEKCWPIFSTTYRLFVPDEHFSISSFTNPLLVYHAYLVYHPRLADTEEFSDYCPSF